LETALMMRAIDLARRCENDPGRVSPKVGAVLARDGMVLGEAFRGELAIRGRGELRLRAARIEIARFDSDLMAQIEELNREFSRLHGGLQRTKAQTVDPADPEQLGPTASELVTRIVPLSKRRLAENAGHPVRIAYTVEAEVRSATT
jgi:hypothetical protein